MARVATVLKPLEVRRLSGIEGEHNVGGVNGTLLLRVRKTAAGSLSASWLFKIRRGGITQRFGLGAYCFSEKAGALTLLQARTEAGHVLDNIDSGRDPRARTAPDLGARKGKTVAEAFALYLEDCEKHSQEKWKNTKTVEEFGSLYRGHVAAKLGGMLVNDVKPADVAATIVPLMMGRFSSGVKLKCLLGAFFRWCLSSENQLRDTSRGNPAKGDELKDLLPKKELCKQAKHHPACQQEDLPRFVKLLVSDGRLNQMGVLACLFALLTCSRIGVVAKNHEVDNLCYAEWKDIDLTAGKELWTIPAQKMKSASNGDHLVPLSRQAVAILRLIERLGLRDSDAVFVSCRGSVVSTRTVSQLIKKLSADDKACGGSGFVDRDGRRMTIHGTARACFATWAIERDSANQWLIESALHHSTDKYKGAYVRTSLAEERRPLMQAWADHLFEQCPPDWDEIKA